MKLIGHLCQQGDRCVNCANFNLTANTGGCLLNGFFHIMYGIKNTAALGVKYFTGTCQFNAAVCSHQKLGPYFLFQQCELTAHRRLRDKKLFCRQSNAFRLCNSNEVFHLLQIHEDHLPIFAHINFVLPIQ